MKLQPLESNLLSVYTKTAEEPEVEREAPREPEQEGVVVGREVVRTALLDILNEVPAFRAVLAGAVREVQAPPPPALVLVVVRRK